ncbi:hypothetical protein PHMEG_00010177 [Phytophthora megakarya]|uniref:Uncharacterized protein n=1 Tax=Phytophthora megakarya TaxID=4795 RepID=A0A225WEX3_9STRA|nr:hypothetical protein PHMEG_00010177 [Phytophthora megakarya]
MDLIDRVRDAVLQQREESVSNYFTKVNDVREFVTDRAPSPGVEITVKMVCFGAERLTADNGMRVTLIDYLAHAMFDDIQTELAELNAINRKPFIVQVTVWDAKKRFGSFRPGAVYEFKQVHGVGFYADIPKGSVQLEEGALDRVVQRVAPILKRKGDREPAGRKAKARLLEDETKSGSTAGIDLVAPSRTRGAAGVKT